MKPRLMKCVLAIIFLAACTIGPAAQENKQASPKAEEKPSVTLSVGANLVIVPVIVTDKHGQHVPGLKTEDFEVKEDGVTQKIVRLDEVSADSGLVTKAASAEPNTFTNRVSAEHPKKLVIITLDQINTPFQNSKDGNRTLVDFLSKNVDANTLIALVALQQNGVHVIHDFTSSPSILVAAVQKLKNTIGTRDTITQDTLGDTSQADLEVLQLTAILNGANIPNSGNPADLLAAARATTTAMRAQVDASRIAQDSLITLENFQQLALYFGGIPGRKSLIWASTGFPFALGASAQASTRGTLIEDWQRTVRMLTDANISVYPVDIGGLLPGAGANTLQSLNTAAMRSNNSEGAAGVRSQQLDAVGNGSFLDPQEGRHESMRQVAEMTGGQPFYNSNDGRELFRRAGEDAAQYYMLSYYTKDTGKYAWRKLSVKVHHNDVKVRARSGFFFRNPSNETEGTRQAEEKMAVFSDLDFTGMPVSGSWQQTEPAGGQRKVHFLLSVPAGVPFIDNERQNHLSFDFMAVARDAGGKVVAQVGQRLETNLDAQALAQVQGKGLDYSNILTLPPGQYKVHFVVRDNLKGVIGSMSSPLKVE
ncbi:MAG: VWA domain-containing protein [Candidatus Angelobacter sp.]